MISFQEKLDHINLDGNCVRGCLPDLLGAAPFLLRTFNAEGSMLSARDLDFLAGSKHAATLDQVTLGDIDLEHTFPGILNLVRSLKKVEVLDLCMEGYERFGNVSKPLTEAQGRELLLALRDRHASAVRILNFGGCPWEPPFLRWCVDTLLGRPADGGGSPTFPSLESFVLPVDGLGRDAVDRYTRSVKLRLAAGFEPSPEHLSPASELWALVRHVCRTVRAGHHRAGDGCSPPPAKQRRRGGGAGKGPGGRSLTPSKWGFQYQRAGLGVTRTDLSMDVRPK